MNLKELLFGKQLARIHAAQYQHSTQKWLPVADIQDGIVILKDGRFIKILEVLPVNFALKSSIERQNIIYYYASYLKIAPDNLQIKVVTQRADIEGYVSRLRSFCENEPVESCRYMIEDNINEVTYLAANEAVTRRFFLIFQHEARMKTRRYGLQAVADRLREEEQTARRYLGMCGLEVLCPDYSDNFQLELLYSLLNKRTSRHSKLPLEVFSSCTKVFDVTDDELKTIFHDEGSADDEAGKRVSVSSV